MMTTRALRALPIAAMIALHSPAVLLSADDPAPLAVAAQGRIQPASRIVRLAPTGTAAGTTVAKLLVDEGADVPAGAPLAELSGLAAARAQQAAAQAEYASADASRKLAVLAFDRAELDAAVARADAVAALAVARTGAARRHVSAARLEELRLTLVAREADLDRLRRSREETLAPHARAVDVARLSAAPRSGDARRVADAELARAEAGLALAARDYDTRLLSEAAALVALRAGLRDAEEQHALPLVTPEELALAELRVRNQEAQAAATRRLLEGEVALTIARAAAAAARAESARLAAEDAVVTAPFAGKVLRIHARTGEAVGPAGLLEFADTNKILVIAEVSAADLPRVALGDRAAIRVPGLADEIAGKVVRISPLISANDLYDDNPTASKDLRVAAVEIEPEAPGKLAGLLRARVAVRLSR